MAEGVALLEGDYCTLERLHSVRGTEYDKDSFQFIQVEHVEPDSDELPDISDPPELWTQKITNLCARKMEILPIPWKISFSTIFHIKSGNSALPCSNQN